MAGAYDDYKSNKLNAAANLISLIIVFVFIFSFFDPEIANSLGYFVIPMFGIGIIWEFFSAVKDATEHEAELAVDQTISKKEGAQILNIACFINALVVVPGYLAGLKLCLDAFGKET